MRLDENRVEEQHKQEASDESDAEQDQKADRPPPLASRCSLNLALRPHRLGQYGRPGI